MRKIDLIKTTYSLPVSAEESRLLDAMSDADFAGFVCGVTGIPGVLQFELCEEADGEVFEYEVHQASIGQNGVQALHAEIVRRLEGLVERQRTAEQQAAPGDGR
jgi:hypothetical protein